MRALIETFPMISRLKMLRQWGGIVDMTGDRSPILSKTPVEGVFINCGWGTGGFKATPGSGWCNAWTIANDEPHPLNAAFTLDWFDQESDRVRRNGLAQRPRAGNGSVERSPSRIEIEDQLVRVVRLVGPAQPAMEFDRGLIGQISEPLLARQHEVPDRL